MSDPAGGPTADRPTLVYDDDCGFCTWCAEWAVSHGEFEPIGFSALTDTQRERLPPDYEECVHLFADGRVYSCGRATEEVLARSDAVPGELFDFLGQFDDYGRFRETLYRWGADRRDWLGVVLSADSPVSRRE
ncbi:DUF393 domain-containing protein [Halobacteriales archaeon QS_4_69_34]|nr:MAG: DUF393 domain-containing protein [Halobacteriales archaeon QS_4_69_34]